MVIERGAVFHIGGRGGKHCVRDGIRRHEQVQAEAYKGSGECSQQRVGQRMREYPPRAFLPSERDERRHNGKCHCGNGKELEKSIVALQHPIGLNRDIKASYSTRYLAIKYLEGDKDVEKTLQALPNYQESSYHYASSLNLRKASLKSLRSNNLRSETQSL